MPSVLAVCVVATLHPDAGPVGVTAIDKRPVDGPVNVGPYGLHADVQADCQHHGGPDQAVYAYGDEDGSGGAASSAASSRGGCTVRGSRRLPAG